MGHCPWDASGARVPSLVGADPSGPNLRRVLHDACRRACWVAAASSQVAAALPSHHGAAYAYHLVDHGRGILVAAAWVDGEVRPYQGEHQTLRQVDHRILRWEEAVAAAWATGGIQEGREVAAACHQEEEQVAAAYQVRREAAV